MILDEQIAQCTGTADLIPMLREEFKAGRYEDVIDAIQRFLKKATANRWWARRRLHHVLKPFVHNYVVSKTLLPGESVLEWDIAFPELMKEIGEPEEESWDVVVEDGAIKGPEAFANAVKVIARTCEQFKARSASEKTAVAAAAPGTSE